ncbi:S-formylglutathione hydrolase [Achromobacter xylosoxidans]|uniref:S-formylglutathione hydrolase n=2 Tax=Achromobacter TaxID=222 RepID=A0A848N7D5_9BURK|nr:S-formylglutathione hydrolase [Achromobacter ruhlandii]AMG44062.1 S-formylglutathione hydrolase [Achromobacter xylosoxidans]MCZ8399024.1 S-formylglutathione hydrolase [Achromobacter ruhlandii]MEB6664119.1 S-formylglutathione hydrolase [Achromobacter ruhlandii]NMU88438.1 S-formylglutathione hydrolase [Achromobacter ruhlandii]OCZ73389.1 S-formylglutathione hydrolase [Achromobacter xylosoxidans]
MPAALELISQHRCFGGSQRYYRHESAEIGLPMRFSVFVPPQAEQGKVPVLFYLAGLTCTEETFMIKAGAQRLAAELGVMLVAPDTSPRGANVPGEDESWDLGTGAGFYLDATTGPWRAHYRMDSYVTRELHALVTSALPGDADRVGIFGHSMGGHGALVLALRNPGKYRSVSAFAPIAAPSLCPWGKKAFGAYLGDNPDDWAAYDASALMRGLRQPFPAGILVDQGTADQFLAEQLYPEVFEAACATAGQPLELRRQDGYDHGYYFISTFIEDHIRFHVERLGKPAA